MRVICILNELPSAGGGSRKEDSYRTSIRAHIEAGFDVSVFSLRGLYRAAPRGTGKIYSTDQNEISQSCKELGAECVQPTYSASLRDAFAYYSSFASCNWPRLAWHYRRILHGLDRDVCLRRPDVMLALQGCQYSGMIARLMHKRHGIPYIVWERATYYQRGQLTLASARSRDFADVLGAASAVLTVSPQLGESIRTSMNVSQDNMFIMPNPLPDIHFQKPSNDDAASFVHNFAKGRFVFAGWTNWRSFKRLDLLVDAFTGLLAKNSNMCLIIAGPVADKVAASLQDRELSHAVLFTGPLNREAIRQLAHACDCCVIPSDHETFGLPAIEALAAGKPVVATRCGGPESIITEPYLGVLVERGNAAELARAMRDVMDNQHRFAADKISSLCRERYSQTTAAKRWQELYNCVLKIEPQH